MGPAADIQAMRRLVDERMIRAGRREYVQVLRLLGNFEMENLHAAVKAALRMGAVGFDAINHRLLCRLLAELLVCIRLTTLHILPKRGRMPCCSTDALYYWVPRRLPFPAARRLPPRPPHPPGL